MRCLAVAFALTPVVLLELALRIGGPAITAGVDNDPLVDLGQLRPLFVLNHASGRWEIPTSRFNFFRPDSFLAEKPARCFRVFVLGGSTVQGRPYAIETSMSTWLRLRLEASDPHRQFEVVNCGGVSYAGYRVAKILDEVLGHQPDAVVIYTGHNEFLEDRSYANVRQMSALRKALVRVASKLRTVTWLKSKLSRPIDTRTTLTEEVDARLDHVGGLERYKRDPAWRKGVEHHFAQTIQRMITTARRAEVPLILCVPAGEIVETPPFKVEDLPAPNPHVTAAKEQALAVVRDPDAEVDDRLAAAEAYLRIDPQHAGVHFVAGRLCYQRGEAAAADRYLSAARDFDVCPLRATSSIIESVTDAARRNAVPLIDTPRLLDRRDWQQNRIPDGIADPEFFVDHVHPTIAGHQLIGAEIASWIIRLGLVESAADASPRYDRLAAQHLATLGEEYYARGKQRLEGLRRWAAGRAGRLVPPRAVD